MSNGASVNIVALCFHFVPALIWVLIAWDGWRFFITRRPHSHFFRIAPLVATFMALHFCLHVIIELTPTELNGRLAGLHAALLLLIEIVVVASAATFMHLIMLLPVREERPSTRWLICNYGVAVLVAILAGFQLFDTHPARPPMTLQNRGGWVPASFAYMCVVGALGLIQMRRFARRGAWRPGGLEMRYSDVRVAMLGMLFGGLLAYLATVRGADYQTGIGDEVAFLIVHTAFGLAFAMPFVVRMLGHLVRAVTLSLTHLMIAAAIYLGGGFVSAHVVSDETRHLWNLAVIVILALLVSFGGSWLQGWIDWKAKVFTFPRLHRWLPALTQLQSLFRSRQRSELQAFLTTLSPALGAHECIERAVVEVVRVMQLRGAAILLRGDAKVAVQGLLDISRLQADWNALPAESLPARAYAGMELRELPLPVKEALIAADAVGVVPIISPRRRWGDLFIATGFLETATSDDNEATLQIFVSQLALLLDGAELLSRTLAVERHLAHAEKLAAIGELAARIAHEIRNPITAARSLAQQLAREPQSSFHAEHAVILTELERVERQVAALLRFARREEFRFEAVDLAELVRNTAEEFRPRLEAAGIAIGVDTTEGLIASADREKLRQVLVNIIENAVDALGSAPPPRRLALRLHRDNGAAQLQVADSGPGAPAEALPHLFEPFFSLKSDGTGLGLAIAKRTIDAHGGRIRATNTSDAGLTFDIEIPLAEAARREGGSA